jgi:hypothetical protein
METKSSRLDIRCEIVYSSGSGWCKFNPKSSLSLAEDGSKPLLGDRITIFSSLKDNHTHVYVKCVTMLLALPNGD